MTKPRQPSERFLVELVPVSGGDVPPLIRLKAALKTFKRRFELRCVRVVTETK